MWWKDLRATLSQRINVEGIGSSASVLVKDQHLALPHVLVPDVRYIDWGELQRRGFKGLFEYDHDGSKASALEKAIGIKVIRHRVKKPAGTAEEIEKHFGCKSSQLVMVGDRPFTDIVYGNQNGFLTILTKPLSLAEEPFIVRQHQGKKDSEQMRTFHPSGIVNPSHSMSTIAFLKEPKIGGKSRKLSRATCRVCFIFMSSNVRCSTGFLLLIMSTMFCQE
ncbi:phosphatidylglycerophosphate phosphatase 1, chloroplastic/mitochondrial isoform X3 [Populus alba]|uniref:phosphatidylglycerophosphate phosphatase 1, chloroplastic/mitochondrial isoform X3 n=1 Tax=Populus alba TaxID=43335 RepID=UPI003CC70B17